MKILLVDDEKTHLDQAKTFLEKENEEFDIETAISAEQALKMLEDGDLEVIVSDYQMEKMDGLEFLQIIRKERDSDIPFIIFTGKGREEVAMKALNQGAERYLKKGGDPRSQYGVLADAIEQECELYRKDKDLKKSEKEKSLILESTGEIIAYHDLDHNIKWANEAYHEATGLSTEELQGQKCYHAWGLDKVCSGCPVTKAIEEGESIEKELTPKDQEHWPEDQGTWLIKASPVRDDDGDIIGAVEGAADITERKKTEEKLKKSEEKYKNLFYETPLGIFSYDENGVITECNDKFVDVIGSSKDALIGLDMINDLEDEELIEEVKSSLSEGKGYYEGDYTSVTADKTTPVRVMFKGMRDEDGEIYAGIALIEDITERKRKEEELRESRERYRRLFESLDVGIIVHDSEGEIVSANPAATDILGLKEEELRDKDLDYWEGILYTEDSTPMDIKDFPVSRVLEVEEPERGTVIGISPPDVRRLRWYIISAEPHYDENRDIERVITSFKDITELKRVEERIKKSEQKYRRLFESAQDGMLILDAESGEIIDANPFIQDMTGYSLGELVGKHLWEIGTFRDIAENKEKFEKLREKEYVRYEHLPLKTKEGEEKSVEFVSNLYDVGDDEVIQCNIRDITDRKEAEDREEFLHSLLRHDVKNKCQIIRGYLQMLEEGEIDEEGQKNVEKAERVTKEALNIIKKVRKLKKLEEQEESIPVKIDSFLDRVISKHTGQLEEEGIKIEVESSGCRVKGSSLLEELFSNIIENAIKHSNGDKIKVSSKTEDDGCVVTVEDDGKGIPDDKKEEIFKKGFKDGPEAGTGLGMYMVKRIAEKYDGTVECKDSDLGGAKFEMKFQRA